MLSKRHHIAFLAFLAVALQGSAETTTSMTEREAVHQELTQLHQTLVRHAADFAANEGAQVPTGPGMTTLRRELEHLQLRTEQLGTEGRTLLGKVYQLEPLLANLERALMHPSPPPAPPRPQVDHKRSFGAPSNDACANAQLLIQESTPGTTRGATNDGQASCGSSYFSPDVWFEYTATENASVSADTLGAGFDSVLSVHRDCPGTTSREAICNDDTFGLDPAVTFDVSAGETYWIRVSGFDGASGDFEFHLGPGGTICGTVTDAATGMPLSDGSVRASNLSGYIVGTATPAVDGTYEIPVQSDIYTLNTSGFDRYLNQVWDRLQCFPSCPVDQGTAVDVRTNSAVSGVDFALDPGATLRGMVTDAVQGTPVSDAEVEIFDTTGAYLTSAYSTNDGTYSIPGLPGGSIHAAAHHQEYRPQVYENLPCDPGGCLPQLGTLIPIFPGDATAEIDFALQSRGRISGLVTHLGSGDPIANARVLVRNGRNHRVAEARAAADGSYTIGGLESGTYFALAEAPSYQIGIWDGIPCSEDLWSCDARRGAEIAVTTDTTITGIDFALPRFGSLSGTVTDAASGDPLAGAVVTMYRHSGSSPGSARTNSEGFYQISGLPPNSYFVLSAPPGNYLQELYDNVLCPRVCDVTTGTLVQVELNIDRPDIDFELDIGGSIAGTVTSADTGLPIISGQVEILDPLGNRVGANFVGSGGQYTVDGLPPGDYLVQTTQHSYYADALYDDIYCHEGCSFAAGNLISVDLGEAVAGIDFALEVVAGGTGTIRGSVLADPSGAPVPEILVALYDEVGLWVGGTLTNALGNYNFGGVAAGVYFVRTLNNAHYSDELFDSMPCEEDCILLLGTPVHVGEAAVQGVDFHLQVLGGVAGRTWDSSNGDPFFALVEIWAEDGTLVSQTQSVGLYEVDLSPGTYFVTARNPSSHYGSQLWNGLPCSGRHSIACEVTAGTPVHVASELVTGIDLALDPPGRLSGRLTDETTGLPLSNARVEFWDAEGYRLSATSTDRRGVYTSFLLPPGVAYVTTDVWRSVDEMYDGRPCLGGAPSGCDPTKGDPVEVRPGVTTRHVSFDLLPLTIPEETNLIGRVTKETGDPLSGVALDFWDQDSRLQRTRYTNAAGEFSLHLEPWETFYVSTDSADGVVNEIWPGIRCSAGSAFDGLCEPTVGTPVSGAEGALHVLEFRLMNQSVFADGFESGDVTAWSRVESLSTP